MIYVSTWVVIWGTASSLVDWLLLNADLLQHELMRVAVDLLQLSIRSFLGGRQPTDQRQLVEMGVRLPFLV